MDQDNVMAARSEYFAATDPRHIMQSLSGQPPQGGTIHLLPSESIQKDQLTTLNTDEHFETEEYKKEDIQQQSAEVVDGKIAKDYVLPITTIHQLREAQYSMQQVETFGVVHDREVPSHPDSSRDFGIANHSPFFHDRSLQHSESSSRSKHQLQGGQGSSGDTRTRNSMRKQQTSNRKKGGPVGVRKQFLATGTATRSLPKGSGQSRLAKNGAGIETGFFSKETLSKYPMLQNLHIVNSRQQRLPTSQSLNVPKINHKRHNQRLAKSNDNLFSFQEQLPADPIEIVPFESTAALPSSGFFVHKNGRQSKDVPMMPTTTTLPNGGGGVKATAATERRPLTSTKSGSQLPTKQLQRRKRNESSQLQQATSETVTVDQQAQLNSLAIDVNAKPVYRTLDSSEFENACMQAATYIDHLQKSTKRLRKTNKLDSPSHNMMLTQSSAVMHKMKSLNIRGASGGSICNIAPSTNNQVLNTGRTGSLSENRSNSAREHSSTKTPLVMRYCFHNRVDKKKLVEANKAAWLEQRESIRAGSNSNLSTHRSPGSSFDKLGDKPISLTKNFVFKGSTKLTQRSASPKIQIREIVGSSIKDSVTVAPQQQKTTLPKTLILGSSSSKQKSRNSTNRASINAIAANQTVKNESRSTKVGFFAEKQPRLQHNAKFKSPLNLQKGTNKAALTPSTATLGNTGLSNGGNHQVAGSSGGKADSIVRVPYQSSAKRKLFQLPTSLLLKSPSIGVGKSTVQLQSARQPHSTNTISPRPFTAAGSAPKEILVKTSSKNFKLPQQSIKSSSLVQVAGGQHPTKEKSIQNSALSGPAAPSQGQVISPPHNTTVLTSRRDSKYLQTHALKQQSISKGGTTTQGLLTRSTNSPIYQPFSSRSKQQSLVSGLPMQKSIVSSNPQVSHKSTVHQVSSLFLSTVSPDKQCTSGNNEGVAGGSNTTANDSIYPPVQTYSCSKPEIFITSTSTTMTTQKKAKQAFSNSVVTKSTVTKPSNSRQHPSLTKHSHRKSSDYYMGGGGVGGGGTSSWKNQSLVYSNTAHSGKPAGASVLQTPIKVDMARQVSAANTTGLGKKHQMKSATVFIGSSTGNKAANYQKTQQFKSRKHCQKALTFQQAAGSLQKRTSGQRQKSRVVSPRLSSPHGANNARPAVRQHHTNQSHLDTIESVDVLARSQKQQDRKKAIDQNQLSKGTSRNFGKTSSSSTSNTAVHKSSTTLPISSQRHNSIYKLPDAAESPISMYIEGDLLREQSLVQKPLVQPPLRSKGHTNWYVDDSQITTGVLLAQTTSYEKGLQMKDCLELRSGSNERSKKQFVAPIVALKDLLLISSTGVQQQEEGSLTPEQICETSLPKEADQVQPPPVCCSLLPQTLSKPLSQYGFTGEDELKQNEAPLLLSTSEKHFNMAKNKLVKLKSSLQSSYSSLSGGGGCQGGHKDKLRSRLPTGPDSKHKMKQLEKRIKSQLHSLQVSHQGSIVNLSLAKTESIAFQPSNPLRILRNMQRDKNYVWLATYDEDILHSGFMRKIGQCTDRCLPWEFVPWRLHDVQPFLLNENCLCLRREPGKETLCKIYLVHIEQVKDIVRLKNHSCDRKQLQAEGLVQSEDDYWKPITELRKKYKVTKLAAAQSADGDDSDESSPSDVVSSADEYMTPGDKTLNVSIPEERTVIQKGSIDQQALSNFIVTMEQQKEFDDLQDIENPPVFDLIYHEHMAMGLPVVFATNRDQSKLDDSIPQTPSYFKHLRSMKPTHELLIRMLQGLISCFPDLTPDHLMHNYIEQIPGIQGKLSDEDVREIVEKSVSGVSIWSDQPHMKLMSPQQTQKMFNLMNNNQVDPSDLHGGYQSLTAYEELQAQQQYLGCDPIDKDVVFLGAEESGGSFDQNDLSLNQLQMIEQFNKDFQYQQQLMLASGAKSGIPGVCSSDTSQVDNFIFQNNINRLSNEVSQEFSDVTPIRDTIAQRNNNNVTGKMKTGTNGQQSRGASSNRQGSENTTSYQGACRILNFQQPIFQSNHWRDTSEDFGKDEDGQMLKSSQNMINRGSSLGMLSQLPSPPFKQMKQQVYSARKTQLFSQEHSAIDIKSIGGVPTAKKTVFTNHKYFDSNMTSARNDKGGAGLGRLDPQIVQVGFEIPQLDDFCNNVDSIKPLAQENGSTHQASNSLFIQSGRSRNKANSHSQTRLGGGCKQKNKPLNVDPQNRFELSQEDFDKVLLEGENQSEQEFEEVMCPDIDSDENQTGVKQFNTGNGPNDTLAKFREVNHLIDGQLSSEEDPVSIREQLVSELSIRRMRKDSHAKCKELERRLTSKFTDCDGVSQPQVELFDQVSDIVCGGDRAHDLIPCQSSKELVLEEETKVSPVHSYSKVRHCLAKHIQIPKASTSTKKKKVMTEVKTKPRMDLIEPEDDFMEGRFDLMNSQAIRGELFRIVGRTNQNN